ncbi:Platelet glycoprotein Ib alpha chain [Durusdinium trenchii]|uniref:Platelet glycoprotein Ib alpha chain n=1 Tax=Durusdinium trenchii TaxID=1381693 RepID=A0ABP0IVE0_9DINO
MWGNLKPLRQYGKLITKHYGSAKYDRGLPKEVSCGDTTTTWNGVSKVCGACDVTIPNINVGDS